MKSKRLNMASIVGATNTQDTDENRYEQPIYGKYNLILLRLLFMFAPNSMDTRVFVCHQKKKCSTKHPNMSSCSVWLCMGNKARKIEIIVLSSFYGLMWFLVFACQKWCLFWAVLSGFEYLTQAKFDFFRCIVNNCSSNFVPMFENALEWTSQKPNRFAFEL